MCAKHLLSSAALGVIVLASVLLPSPGCGLVKEMLSRTPAPVREGACPFGAFRRVNGVGVLTLWGTPYQRGFAHGKLMAPAVLEMVDVVGGSNLLLSHRRDYERRILPLMDSFVFEPDDEAELRGVFDGVWDELGERAVLRRLGRPLTLADLKAYNTCGDWYRQACSSFAAWGSRAKDGHVWVGRNFDFLPAKAVFPYQMIVVHPRLGERRAWATVSVPGMIGCITGINEEGVFAAVHDVYLPHRPLKTGYSPRLLTLRRLMETCGASDLEAQARPQLEARRQMFDNAILLAAPVKDGTPPALIFEVDDDRSRDRGVTVRRPDDNEKALSREMIACANHYRKRGEPKGDLADYRYPLLRRILMTKTDRGLKVDFDMAHRAMGAARLPITVHTVVADLNTLDFWFAAGEFLSPPGSRDYVALPMREWLGEK